MRNIKDKEGVIFKIVNSPNVEAHMRQKKSIQFIIEHIENQLKFNNVNPINNQVGFHGDKDALAYYLGGLIDTFNEINSNVKHIAT